MDAGFGPPETVELIAEVGEPNLGIGFDTWHLWDTPNLFEHMRARARRIMGVHQRPAQPDAGLGRPGVAR